MPDGGNSAKLPGVLEQPGVLDTRESALLTAEYGARCIRSCLGSLNPFERQLYLCKGP